MTYMELTNDIIVTNIVESPSSLQGEPAGSLSPSRAEEIDFLSINEWIKAQDDGQPMGHDK